MKLTFESTDGIARVTHRVVSYVVAAVPDPHRPGSRGYVNLLVETTKRIAGIVSTASNFHWQYHVGAAGPQLDGIIEVENYFIEASGRFDFLRDDLVLVASAAWDERDLRRAWSATDRDAASFGAPRKPPPPPVAAAPKPERPEGGGAPGEARRASDAFASAQWWAGFNDQFFGGPGASAGFVEEFERFGGARTRFTQPGTAPPPTVSRSVAAALRFLDLPPDRLPTPEALKAAWSTAARKTHPDAGGSSDAFVKAKAAHDEIVRALSDPRGRG